MPISAGIKLRYGVTVKRWRKGRWVGGGMRGWWRGEGARGRGRTNAAALRGAAVGCDPCNSLRGTGGVCRLSVALVVVLSGGPGPGAFAFARRWMLMLVTTMCSKNARVLRGGH